MADPSIDTPAGSPPSQAVRTVLTLLILWHLFAVGLAMATLSGPPSQILFDIKRRAPGVAPYLRTLWMDVNYGNTFTQAGPADVGCVLVATVTMADGPQQRLIPDPVVPERRREVDRRLVNRIVTAEGDDMLANANILLQQLGAELLRETRARKVDIVCRMPREERLAELIWVDPGRREVNNDQFYETVRTVAVTLGSDGKPSLTTTDAPGRAAPVRRPSAPPGNRAAPPSSSPPPE